MAKTKEKKRTIWERAHKISVFLSPALHLTAKHEAADKGLSLSTFIAELVARRFKSKAA